MALEEDSLQELMGVCSNGASLKEWSHADVVRAIILSRQVLENLICEDMQLAVEERPQRWIF